VIPDSICTALVLPISKGEIDKETQSLKNEGAKQVAKIGAAGSLYSNLVSGFWG
jgi:hypothetical protein